MIQKTEREFGITKIISTTKNAASANKAQHSNQTKMTLTGNI